MSTNTRNFVADHVAGIPRSGIRDFFDIVQRMPEAISLGVGEPDFVTPWHIREAAIYALERGRTQYTANLGLLRLRESIAVYVQQKFGVRYDPQNQILVTVGVSEALDLALRAVLNPGDEVIYHEPCYVSYAPSVVLAHAKPVPVACRAEDGFAVSAKALEAAITPRSKVLMLSFPTNPTGGTMTRAQLEEVAAVVRKHNLLVLTDEIYSELTFEGEHVSIASLPGMAERTIFLHGFSDDRIPDRVCLRADGADRGDDEGPPVRDHVREHHRAGSGGGGVGAWRGGRVRDAGAVQDAAQFHREGAE